MKRKHKNKGERMEFYDLELIYNNLLRADLTESQYDFDRYYLSRKIGYYGWLKSGNHKASTETVFRLFLNLKDLEENEDLDPYQVSTVNRLISHVWLQLVHNTPTSRQSTSYGFYDPPMKNEEVLIPA